MRDNKEIEVAAAEVVDYMRITGQFAPALREVVRRKVASETAKKDGIKVSDNELQKAADAFRLANGLKKARDTNVWLKSNGISMDALEEFLETNILISKFKDKLEKKANKKKYISSQGIQELVRSMAFEDWIQDQLKLTNSYHYH